MSYDRNHNTWNNSGFILNLDLKIIDLTNVLHTYVKGASKTYLKLVFVYITM